MLENRTAIDYLYGEKPGMSRQLRQRKPSPDDWAVAETLVITMDTIVTSISVNQASSEKWILSDALRDVIYVYTQGMGDKCNPKIDDLCTRIMKEEQNSDESLDLCKNIRLLSMKIRQAITDKLRPFLSPLIDDLDPATLHYMFSFFLDPRFATNLTPVVDLFNCVYAGLPSNDIIRKRNTFISKMKDLLFEYILAADPHHMPDSENQNEEDSPSKKRKMGDIHGVYSNTNHHQVTTRTRRETLEEEFFRFRKIAIEKFGVKNTEASATEDKNLKQTKKPTIVYPSIMYHGMVQRSRGSSS